MYYVYMQVDFQGENLACSQIVIHTIDVQKIQGKGTYQGRRNRGQVDNLGVLCLCPLPHFLTEFSEIADCLANKQK